MNNTELVRRYYDAWPAHDLATVEQLTAEGFHSTSPADNRLDRATLLERCWPNNANLKTLEIQSAVGYAIRCSSMSLVSTMAAVQKRRGCQQHKRQADRG
jgi:hypothetical protein